MAMLLLRKRNSAWLFVTGGCPVSCHFLEWGTWVSVYLRWLPCSPPPFLGAWHPTHNHPWAPADVVPTSLLFSLSFPSHSCSSLWLSTPLSLGRSVSSIMQWLLVGRNHVDRAVVVFIPVFPAWPYPVHHTAVCWINNQAWVPLDLLSSTGHIGSTVWSPLFPPCILVIRLLESLGPTSPQQWGIFLLPPVAWQRIPVSDTRPHGKEPWWPCHPVIPRVPGNTLGLGTLGTGIVWCCPRPVYSSLRHFSCCWVVPDAGDSKIFLVLWGPSVRWFAPSSLRLPEWHNMEDPY